MFRLILLCVIILGAILIFFNRDTIFSPFEGIGRRTVSEAGFPVRLPGSAGYSINSFDNGFMLLTETYVYVYDPDGAQRYNRRHSYSEPNVAVADTRILTYNKNGRQFSFFGRNGLIYEKEADGRILYGAIGENNSTAIVYRNDVYANTLEINNRDGNWRYRKQLFNENIMQIAFTSSDNDIIVTSIGFGTDSATAGDITAAVQKYDTSIDDKEKGRLWRTVLPGNAIPFALHVGRNSVFVLCDNSLFTLDLSNGRILSSYDYRGNLIDFSFSASSTALLIDDFIAGTANLISLNHSRTTEAAITEVSAGASQVEIHDGAIYILEPGSIVIYDLNTASSSQYLPLEEEYSRFIHVGNEILLLGYNNVDKLSKLSS
jgi:hypothetical protein